MRETLRAIKRQCFRSLTAHIERRALSHWFQDATLGGRILDIGGGASPYQKHLQQDSRLINLDIERGHETTLLADAHALPFAPESLDAVICTNVLEHLRAPTVCIQEINRVLRRRGELIVIVPFMFKVHPNPEDHWRFTWQCLGHLFLPDYEVVDHFVSGGRFAVIWEIVCQVPILQFLRIINPILARLPLENRDYALSYGYRLVKK